MPTSTRKSSIGISTRRASQQKGYIPYRGDNPEVGKKTGIAVRHVERKSDGFEPFEEVMRQADARTPPRPKSKKQKVQLPSIDDDEDGEMSMELDDNNNTPLAYLKNTRQQPLSANRVGSSSRPVGRPSLIDYDQIPSPGPLSNRFSIASTSAGPSNLSKAYAPGDDDDDDDDDNIDFNDGPPFDPDDVGTVHNDDSDELPQAIDTQKLSRRSSFAAIDQDDDDHDAPPDPPDPDSPSPPRLNGKGKGRATEEDMEVDNEMEEDISRGLGEPEDMNEDEPEPEPQVVKPVAKRGRPPGKRPAKEPRRSCMFNNSRVRFYIS
ncbi:hypothetical protein ONZ45_g14715 [Pleurotus djamor]|nr:hypothetical protein ONZ45_g14715 [Pleurotus djamor]